MEEESIEAQVQRELDALSLDDLNNDDDDCSDENYQTTEEKLFEMDDEKTTSLYLAKSSARSKHSHAIIQEAEELLSKTNLPHISKFDKRPEELAEHISNDDIDVDTLTLLYDRRALISAKTADEIEEENLAKEQELEQHLKADEEKVTTEIIQAKNFEEEELKRWKSKEEKVTKSVKIMLDKADYWEKTYEEVAHDEFLVKQKELEEEYHRSQKKIIEMENMERKFLEDLLHEQKFLVSQKQENAAITIQKNFRGHYVRKKYGAEVQIRMKNAREHITAKKIAAIEERRRKDKARKAIEMEENKQNAECPEKEIEDKVVNSDISNDDVIIQSEQKLEEPQLADKSDSKNQQNDNTTLLLETGNNEMKCKTEEPPKNAYLPLTTGKNDQPITETEHNYHDFEQQEVVSIQGDAQILNSGIECKNDNDHFDNQETNHCGDSTAENGSSTSTKTDDLPDSDTTTPRNRGDDVVAEVIIDKTSSSASNEMQNTIASEVPSNIEEIHTHAISNPAGKTWKVRDGYVPFTEKHAVAVPNGTDQEMGITLKATTDHSSSLVHETRPLENEVVINCRTAGSNFSDTNVQIENIESLAKNRMDAKKFDDLKLDTKSSDDRTTSEVCHSESTHPPNKKCHSNRSEASQNHVDISVSDPCMTSMRSFDDKIDSKNPKDKSYNSIDKPSKMKGQDSLPQDDSCEVTMNDVEMACTATQNPRVTSKDIAHQNADGMSDQSEILFEVGGTFVPNATDILAQPNQSKNSDSDKGEIKLNPNEDFMDSYQYNGNCDDKALGNVVTKSSVTEEISECTKITEPVEQVADVAISKSPDKSKANHGVQVEKPLDGAHNLNTISTLDNHMDSQKSYELLIQEQHRAWSERIHKFTRMKEKRKSREVQRRKMIRASSAAKRLATFTEDEIFQGAFISSNCDISTKTTSVNEIRCVVQMNISGGRNLNCFARYVGLSHLLVQNCGLLSLEGLQSCQNLKYISAPNNAINLISCSGMKQLEFVDLSHNRLTSIHGLDQCENLLFLDLSHNNITKITGLEDTHSLAHVRLSDNQLLSVSGLSSCGNLIYLDVSDNHLTNLDYLADNKLLVSVAAAGNYIEYLEEKFLDSATLLITLNVSRNSLQSLGMTEKTWLPTLVDIQAETNQIGCDPPQSFQNFAISCPFLCSLNLRQNLLPDLNGLKSLRNCQCLNHVDVTDNPMLTSDIDDQHFLKSMPEIVTVKHDQDDPNLQKLSENHPFEKYCVLKSLANDFTNLMQNDSDDDVENIINTLSVYLHKAQIETKRHIHDIQKAFVRSSTNSEVFPIKNNVPPAVFTLHSNHLKKMLQISSECRRLYDTFERDKNPKTSPKMNSSLRKEMLNPSGCPPTNCSNSNEKVKDVSHEELTSDCERTSPAPPISSSPFSSQPSSVVPSNQISRNFEIYKKLRTAESGALENVAAKKLQSYWRGYRVRKRHALIKSARQSAAVMIQALWRGYNTRRKIQQAMNMLKKHEKADVMDDDELEDVDLDGFNFDEQLFEKQWAYRVTGKASQSEEYIKKVPQNSPQSDYVMEYQRPRNPETISLASSKPPLPPISPARYSSANTRSVLTPTLSETLESNPMNSSRSSKQDVLSNEWGIKSSSTADLMMKRARRMKGAKKKIRTADEKLQKFQDRVSSFQGADLTTTRRPPPHKVDYFKAQEEEFRQKDYVPTAEDEQKMNYTYEWLHKQVGAHYNDGRKNISKKPNLSDVNRTRSGLFPSIPRSPSLVGVQDLEVVSLNSGSNFSERSKDRLRDIARRHNPHIIHDMK